MIFNQTLPAQGGGGQGTHSVTCTEGLYVASQQPDSWQTAKITEMDFTAGATVYIFCSTGSGNIVPPVVKASNGTSLAPTGHGTSDFNVWWSYSMPDYCVIASNTTTTITTHYVSVDSGSNIILATADNSEPLQSEGECVVGTPVFILAYDDRTVISTSDPDTEPFQAFSSDEGMFWSFVMPDSDIVIYES